MNSGKQTHAVGELAGNPFGIHDIHGNVQEWVQDWWEPAYYSRFQERPAIDPSGPTSGSLKLFRGGHWYHLAAHCRSAGRHAFDLSTRRYYLGFRAALTVDAVKAATGTTPVSSKSPVIGAPHALPAN